MPGRPLTGSLQKVSGLFNYIPSPFPGLIWRTPTWLAADFCRSPLKPRLAAPTWRCLLMHPALFAHWARPGRAPQGPRRTSQPAQSVSSEAFAAPGSHRTASDITSAWAHSSSPTWLGLGHASSVLTGVSRCQPSPRTSAPPLFCAARAPGLSKCPASRLIASWARHRGHHFPCTPPEPSWHVPGLGHSLAP